MILDVMEFIFKWGKQIIKHKQINKIILDKRAVRWDVVG